MRDEQTAHALADFWHPVAVAERRAESKISEMISRLRYRKPLERPHAYRCYWCLTCDTLEIACRAGRLP